MEVRVLCVSISLCLEYSHQVKLVGMMGSHGLSRATLNTCGANIYCFMHVYSVENAVDFMFCFYS